MQYLGLPGFHSGAFTGCQDANIYRISHSQSLPLIVLAGNTLIEKAINASPTKKATVVAFQRALQ
jgi:hypothetical protein